MIRPEDFLALAEAWLRGPTEAEWRSAVSRAYYAVFHSARERFRLAGFVVPRGDQAHAYFWYRLSNCDDIETQTAGRDLNTLRRDRNFADYDVDRNLRQKDANAQVNAAKRIISVLTTAFAEPTRSQIIEEMKTYERDVLKDVTWKPLTP